MAKFLLHPRNDQSDETVRRDPAVLLKSDGIPDLRADTVSAHDQVGFEDLASLEREAAVRVGSDAFGIGPDLDPHGPGAPDQGVMQVAPGHDAPGQTLEGLLGDRFVVHPGLVGWRGVGPFQHLIKSANAFQHAQAIVPEIDARPEGPQFGALLVQSDIPTLLPESDSGG
jgi:hypothetical protein